MNEWWAYLARIELNILPLFWYFLEGRGWGSARSTSTATKRNRKMFKITVLINLKASNMPPPARNKLSERNPAYCIQQRYKDQ